MSKKKIQQLQQDLEALNKSLETAEKEVEKILKKQGDKKPTAAETKTLNEANSLVDNLTIERDDLQNELAELEGVTPTGYAPEEKEKGIFHVRLTKPSFNPTTGEDQSISYVQKFTKAEWRQFSNNNRGLGFTTEILWNPLENK